MRRGDGNAGFGAVLGLVGAAGTALYGGTALVCVRAGGAHQRFIRGGCCPGYAYRYGSENGTLEVQIDGEWWIFAVNQ